MNKKLFAKSWLLSLGSTFIYIMISSIVNDPTILYLIGGIIIFVIIIILTAWSFSVVFPND